MKERLEVLGGYSFLHSSFLLWGNCFFYSNVKISVGDIDNVHNNIETHLTLKSHILQSNQTLHSTMLELIQHLPMLQSVAWQAIYVQAKCIRISSTPQEDDGFWGSRNNPNTEYRKNIEGLYKDVYVCVQYTPKYIPITMDLKARIINMCSRSRG